MLLIDFFQFSFFINLLIITILIYIIFLKVNNHKNIKTVSGIGVVLTNNKKITTQSIIFYIRLGVCIFGALLLHLQLYRGFTMLVFWDNIFLSNTNIFIYNIIVLFALFITFVLNIILKFDRELKNEFFFAFFNIALWTPCIFFSNNLFILIVLLELNSSILFFLLITSKILYTQNKTKNKNSVFFKNKNYVNVVFFNYWSTFFASILLLYAYTHLYINYGSTNVKFLNNGLIQDHVDAHIFTIFIFVFALFLKMGLTPLHLFKLEIYKNISYIYIFLYSTFFFFLFVMFFSYVYLIMLGDLLNKHYIIIVFFIMVGFGFNCFIIFDINQIKHFFAYSTIINSMLFLILLLAF